MNEMINMLVSVDQFQAQTQVFLRQFEVRNSKTRELIGQGVGSGMTSHIDRDHFVFQINHLSHVSKQKQQRRRLPIRIFSNSFRKIRFSSEKIKSCHLIARSNTCTRYSIL